MSEILIKGAFDPLFSLRNANNGFDKESLDKSDAANGAKTVLRGIANSNGLNIEQDLGLAIPVAAEDFVTALHSIKDKVDERSNVQLKLFLLLLDRVFTLNADAKEDAIAKPLQALREVFREPLATVSRMSGAQEFSKYFAERWGINLSQLSESSQ